MKKKACILTLMMALSFACGLSITAFAAPQNESGKTYEREVEPNLSSTMIFVSLETE